MQVGILDFNITSNIINNRDSGELTLAISSLKTRVDHLAGHNNKGLVFMTEQQSWKRLLLSSCKYPCPIKRAQSQPSRI